MPRAENFYAGRREDGQVIVTKNGAPLSPARSLTVRHTHSGEFAWGDETVESAQLALALLLEEVGHEQAVALFHGFKRDVIAKLKAEHGWEIGGEAIRRWVAGWRTV